MRRVAIAVGLTFLAGSAFAQGTSALNPPNAAGSSGSSPIPRQDNGIATSAAPAVIHPGNPDPGMTVMPPAAGVTPVVPPPGTGGNNPTVVPK